MTEPSLSAGDALSAPPAEAMFCAALASASVDVSNPAALRDIVAIAQRNWQTQPLIHDHLQGLSWPACVAADADWLAFQRQSLALLAFSTIQLQSLAELCDALSAAGIRYSLLKGSAARLIGYANPLHRTGWDMDVAVEQQDLGRAADVVFELGYAPAQLDHKSSRFTLADARLRAAVEANHYELGFIVRRNRVTGLLPVQAQAIRDTLDGSRHWWVDADGQFNCYSSVDIHHGLSLDISASELLVSSRRLEWDGRVVWVPNLAWLVLHLIYKLYWEGVHAYGKGLYQYADLCRLVALMQPDDDRELMQQLDAANLRAAAYYVLRRLPSAFGQPLSGDLANYVEACGLPESDDPMRCNDLGDMWEKLWNRRGSARPFH